MDNELRIPKQFVPWVNLGFGILLVAALVVWTIVALRLVRRQPLIRVEPRTPVPWKAWHVAVTLLSYLFSLVLSDLWLRWTLGPYHDALLAGKPEVVVPFLVDNAIISLITGLVIAGFLCLASGATRRDLGIGLRKIPHDVGVGLAVFVASLPIVFAITMALSLIYRKPHLIETILGKNPTSEMMLLAMINAILVAPILEEFLFRVVLQGWLERLLMHLRPARRPNSATVNLPIDRAFLPPTQTDPTNPYASPSQIAPDMAEPSGGGGPLLDCPADSAHIDGLGNPRLRAALPIVISSALFAALHIGHGLDPIPLFVFALALGFVYQRTHRLWPSVTVHMALNGLSMVQLWLILRH